MKFWPVSWHLAMGKICMCKSHAAEILTILEADGLTKEIAGPVAGAPLALLHMFMGRNGEWIAHTCSWFSSFPQETTLEFALSQMCK